MPNRQKAPIGAPCWADLFTSDVEGSRRFYAELFGWEAGEASPEFGGYFMFMRDGVPVAGAMGPMDDEPADNTWKPYLATDDIARTVKTAEAEGGTVAVPAMPVADLGIQAVLVDPTGATIGAWQPGTFEGFSVLGEPGAPSWFELITRQHPAAVAFYRSVFGWELDTSADTDEFRYYTVKDPSGDGEVAGLMDGAAFLPPDEVGQWAVYFDVDDAAATAAKAVSLGGTIVAEPMDTPYGVLATIADPAGAQFKLRKAPSQGSP
jgi:predicted enzyme related to lactoylglutathione lyase